MLQITIDKFINLRASALNSFLIFHAPSRDGLSGRVIEHKPRPKELQWPGITGIRPFAFAENSPDFWAMVPGTQFEWEAGSYSSLVANLKSSQESSKIGVVKKS